jgi:phosphonopyruvate decarboxylase
MDEAGRPYALVMQKGTVAPYALKPGASAAAKRSGSGVAGSSAAALAPRAVLEPLRLAADARSSRHDALREVVARTPAASTAVLASTGFCGRELYAIDDRPNQLYMVGSMGCVVPLALGLALARPDLRVIALDGDGAALMRMGAFATVGAYGPPNLQHLLLDNGVHDSTGGQATVSGHVSFAEIAAACGYASSLETDDVARIGAWLESQPIQGPSVTPVDVKTRLMQHFGSSAGAP